MKVLTFVGTRPEIIRMSCTIAALDASVDHILVNTNQNFDPNLNRIFFDDLGVREPDRWLSVAGNTTMQTIANVILEAEVVIREIQPDVVLVLGDTNSAYSLLSAKKLGIFTVHVEAGNRSFDRRVPEELNRKVVDHISDLNVCYSEFAAQNLIREGLNPNSIIKLGSPLFEVIEKFRSNIDRSDILRQYNLENSDFVLLSLHRNENLSCKSALQNIFSNLNRFCVEKKSFVIVTSHPALIKALTKFDIKVGINVKFLPPFNYSDYCKLQENAMLVVSDSGTIVEETAILGVPALVLRANHERQEANNQINTIQCDPMNPDFQAIYRMIFGAINHGVYSIKPLEEYCNTNFSTQLLLNILSGFERFKANRRLQL